MDNKVTYADIATTITIDDKTYFAELGRVDGTMLGIEDHGILMTYLYLDYAGSSQGAGGICLDEYNEEKKRRVGSAFGLDWIMRTLEVAGVYKWEDLKGVYLYALKEDHWGMVKGLVNAGDKSKVFIFEDLAKEHGLVD